MIKRILCPRSEALFSSYVQEGLLTIEEYTNIMTAKKEKEIIEIIEEKFKLTETNIMKIWKEIIYERNGFYYSNNDIDSFINEPMIVLIKVIMFKGIISMPQVLSKYIRSSYLLENKGVGASYILQESGIIDVIKIKNKKYYLLNLKFYNEVVTNETGN